MPGTGGFSLKRKASGALLVNPVSGALCSTCCRTGELPPGNYWSAILIARAGARSFSVPVGGIIGALGASGYHYTPYSPTWPTDWCSQPDNLYNVSTRLYVLFDGRDATNIYDGTWIVRFGVQFSGNIGRSDGAYTAGHVQSGFANFDEFLSQRYGAAGSPYYLGSATPYDNVYDFDLSPAPAMLIEGTRDMEVSH